MDLVPYVLEGLEQRDRMLQDCEVDQTLHAEVYASACMHTPTAGCCSITSYVMQQLHVVGGQW